MLTYCCERRGAWARAVLKCATCAATAPGANHHDRRRREWHQQWHLHHAAMFTGPHRHQVFKGAGHNPPQERPAEWVRAVLDAPAIVGASDQAGTSKHRHVTPDQVAEQITCGPSVERHLKAINKYIDAGFDHIVLTQIGPDQSYFLELFEQEFAPALRQKKAA